MNGMKKFLPLVVACVLLLSSTQAQYETPRDYSPFETRYFWGGAMLRDFAPRAGYTGSDSLAIRFNTWMPMIGFHQGSLDVQFGYTRFSLKDGMRTAIFFCTTLANDLPLVKEGPAVLMLPVLLSVDYTKAESPGAERDHFNVASAGLGTGLRLRLISPGTELTAHAAALYHFSFEGFNTGNGSSLALTAEASLLLRTLHIGDGIVLGYRFRHQNWSLGEGRLNYRVTTHGPYIGVLL